LLSKILDNQQAISGLAARHDELQRLRDSLMGASQRTAPALTVLHIPKENARRLRRDSGLVLNRS
jgi:hypothetical protein